MSWTVVARKDFADARRSLSLWALTGLFVLFMGGMAVLYRYLPVFGPEADDASAAGLLVFLAAPVTLFIAIAAIVIAARSIVAEVEIGSAKLLLSLPHSRRDVLVGKVLGRTGVLLVGLGIGFLATLALMVVLFERVALADYLLFGLTTVVFARAYISLMGGISAGATSTARAMAYALGTFVVLEFLWDVVPVVVLFVANGFSMPAAGTAMPEWLAFLAVLPPSQAFLNALTVFAPGSVSLDAIGIPNVEGAFFLSGWFSLGVLLLWGAIPLAIGYARFRRADL